MKTTSCSTHKKVSTILLYIYFTRKPVNIQDLYFPRRKGKILRLARSGRGLGQRPILAISVHIMSGRGARRESPSLFLRPAHRGSEGECTGVGAGQLFRSKCFRQSACGFMKDLWAGWLRGESLYPDEKRVKVRKYVQMGSFDAKLCLFLSSASVHLAVSTCTFVYRAEG